MDMDLRELFLIMRRWLWLLILGAILGGVSTYIFSVYQQPVYEATTEVFISQPRSNELSELGYLNAYQLLPTYAELMVTDDVLNETATRTNYVIEAENISVQQIRDTQILQVKVEDTDPVQAAAFANMLVVVFREQQYELQTARYADSKENLETNMEEQRVAIDELLEKMAAIPNTAEYKVEREWTNLLLVQANDIYSNLLNNYESLRLAEAQSISTVQLVELAKPDDEPIRPNILTNVILGITVGLMLSGGIVFLVEYLDDTVRTPEEISRGYDLSTLGYIARISIPARNKRTEGVHVLLEPRSPISEAFRSLRTNIEFAGIVSPIRTILVTSPGPKEGKSTVSANLAAVMMQGGKRVIIVDCDQRRPRIHKLFGMQNRLGLTGIFRGQVNLNDAAEKYAENLSVITSGAIPPNPAELLGSTMMDKIINRLSEMADIVILDSPPMVVTDPAILSTKVDGVILVVNPGLTKKEAFKAAMTQLKRSEARILGVVVNQIGKKSSHYYEYYYAKSYYQTDKQKG